ncbi:MAG: AP2 domain-containing protein [Chloroflexales bacterium]|nr:AP2 domain-containing protein [Chloroflexales bacterium]
MTRDVVRNLRTFNGQTFLLDAHSPNRIPLDALAERTEGAMVTWEEDGLILRDGTPVGPRYALWVPVSTPSFTNTSPDLAAFASFPNEPPPPAPAPEPKSKRRPKTVKYKSITRIDHPAKRTHGYFVRVQWAGERRSKFFSDKKCGDRLSALADAISWRDATEQELGKPRTERQVVGKARNDTGIVGVRRRKKGGKEVFEATWVVEGNRLGRTSFSIEKHGEKGALKKAIAARLKGERKRRRSPLS